MSNVNSFFRTKLAEKKEDPLIDPGEAAQAGIAFAYGPLSQVAIPMISDVAIRSFLKERPQYHGDPAFGLKRIKPRLKPEAEEAFKAISELQGIPFDKKKSAILQNLTEGASEIKELKSGDLAHLPKKKSILGGLYNVYPKVTQLDPYMPAFGDESIETLSKIQKSVDSMLDKYKLPKKGVTLNLRQGPLTGIIGPNYNWASKEINLPMIGKEIALHEIGHAAHLTKPGAKSFDLLRKIIHRGANLAVPMAYIAGNEIREMFPGKIDDKAIKFVQDHAPAILASTYAASTIYPEIQATTRAVSHVYKTEGAAEARKVFKRLIPPLLSYMLPVIPGIIGISLAKKWHKDAEGKKKELEKKAGIYNEMSNFVKELSQYTANITRQIGPQTADILELPGKEFVQKMYHSGKNVIKSPEFAAGAATAGIPAAIMTYADYVSPHGKIYTEKIRKLGKGSLESEIEYKKAKAKENITVPAIVGITAAISGGFLNKLWSDVLKVM